jgi:hypothetical protein
LVECFQYSDKGPPPHVTTKNVQGVEFFPGWAVRSADREPSSPACPSGAWRIRYSGDDWSRTTGVCTIADKVAAADLSTDAYRDFTDAAAASQRAADALAAAVAERLEVDLFVTDRPYLRRTTREYARRVAVCDFDEALFVVGLYLRSQGQYVVSKRAGYVQRYTSRTYFTIAARELLASSWRLTAASTQHARGGGDGQLALLAVSLLGRVTRALAARDNVLVAVRKPQNDDTGEEALASLEAALLWLMGALDASAGLVHLTLGLRGSVRDAA